MKAVDARTTVLNRKAELHAIVTLVTNSSYQLAAATAQSESQSPRFSIWSARNHCQHWRSAHGYSSGLHTESPLAESPLAESYGPIGYDQRVLWPGLAPMAAELLVETLAEWDFGWFLQRNSGSSREAPLAEPIVLASRIIAKSFVEERYGSWSGGLKQSALTKFEKKKKI